jgi:hypothetical protein
MMARCKMRVAKNTASSLLMSLGVALTFLGLSSALGFTAGGMAASFAATAALLYAGGTWFSRTSASAPPGAATIVVFDRRLRVVTGASFGSSVSAVFPASIRSDIETRCEAALRGEPSHFICEHRQARFVFDVAPVQNIAGVVLLGVLISGSVADRDLVSATALVR